MAKGALCQAVALSLALAGCDTAQGPDGSGGSAGAGNRPLDAGLDPDANLDDCISKKGVRICGTKAGCFEDGDDCRCARGAVIQGDAEIPPVSVCADAFDVLAGKLCSTCLDGEVCAELPHIPYCVPEDLGNLIWARGGTVTYADGTPYTGEAIPQPAECLGQVGEITLCGGQCGGCGAEQFCTGRSPTHPLGLCLPQGFSFCSVGDCGAGEACLILNSAPTPNMPYPSRCVSASQCPLYESMIPGGVVCG